MNATDVTKMTRIPNAQKLFVYLFIYLNSFRPHCGTQPQTKTNSRTNSLSLEPSRTFSSPLNAGRLVRADSALSLWRPAKPPKTPFPKWINPNSMDGPFASTNRVPRDLPQEDRRVRAETVVSMRLARKKSSCMWVICPLIPRKNRSRACLNSMDRFPIASCPRIGIQEKSEAFVSSPCHPTSRRMRASS